MVDIWLNLDHRVKMMLPIPMYKVIPLIEEKYQESSKTAGLSKELVDSFPLLAKCTLRYTESIQNKVIQAITSLGKVCWKLQLPNCLR